MTLFDVTRRVFLLLIPTAGGIATAPPTESHEQPPRWATGLATGRGKKQMAMTINQVLRDWEVDGVAGSGPHKPILAEMRALLSAMATGGATGLYDFIPATNAGVGSANAIQVTTDVALPSTPNGALIALPIFADNTTSPVTLAINGGLVLTIKTASGNDVAPRGLKAGMIVSGYVSGATFRLLSDQASTAIQAAAEQAAQEAQAEVGRAADEADRSEVARDIAEGYASDAVSQGNVPIYATVQGLPGLDIPGGINAIRLNGYAASDDNGGWPLAAEIPLVSSDKPWHRLSNGGARRWELTTDRPTREMFGARLDASTDDTTALNNAAAYCKEKSLALYGDKEKIAYVNGAWIFDCSILGGGFAVGPSGSIALRPSTNKQYRFEGRIDNLSGDEGKQGLLCQGVDTVLATGRTGRVSVKLESYGFKAAVYGQNLKVFNVEDGSYFESVNTDPSAFVEAHIACYATEVFSVGRIISNGGVLGIASGAYVQREFFDGFTIIGTKDHGLYSSTTPGKILTVINDGTTINTGGTGMKIFSNGTLAINNPTIRGSGKMGIIAVANRAYVKGGSIEGATEAAIYQIGKDVGAGVNTFEEFVVDGVTIRDCLDDGVRISGPGVLNIIRVIDCDIEVQNRPVFVGVPASVQELEIRGGRLKGAVNNDAQLVYAVASVAKVSIARSVLVQKQALTGSVNLIDVTSAKEVNIIEPTFDFDVCTSLIRARNPTGVLNVQGVKLLAGFCTSINQIRSDGSLFVYDYFVSSAGQVIRRGSVNALPTTGTWERGEKLANGLPTAGGVPGWVCVAPGTFGTLSAVTGSITSGSNQLTVNDASGIALGNYIVIAGVTGVKRVTGIVGNVLTTGSSANATVADAAVTLQAPSFKAEANLSA